MQTHQHCRGHSTPRWRRPTAGLPVGFLAAAFADADRPPGPVGELVALSRRLPWPPAPCSSWRPRARPSSCPPCRACSKAGAHAAAAGRARRASCSRSAQAAAEAGLPLVDGAARRRPPRGRLGVGDRRHVRRARRGAGRPLRGPRRRAGLLDDGDVVLVPAGRSSTSRRGRSPTASAPASWSTTRPSRSRPSRPSASAAPRWARSHTRAHMKDVWRPRTLRPRPVRSLGARRPRGRPRARRRSRGHDPRDHQPEPPLDDRGRPAATLRDCRSDSRPRESGPPAARRSWPRGRRSARTSRAPAQGADEAKETAAW